MKNTTRSILFAALAALTSTACGSSGCSNLDTTPGGFPASKRTANAAQLRISSTGVDKVEASPLLFANTVFGPSGQMKVSPSCGSGLCCPGGTPSAMCGAISFDMAPQVGDAPRLDVAPVEGSSRFNVTVRARVKTVADIPINVAGAETRSRARSPTASTPRRASDARTAR